MHYALKSNLYKQAKKFISKGNAVKIWTEYDDPCLEGCTIINNLDDLKKVFKYTYNMGWPVIRVEG